MSSYPSFAELADQVVDKKHFNDIIARQQQIFEINPYKIEKLYTEAVKKIYAQILDKYHVTKEFKILQHMWHQNQRRVFVWYVVVLFDIQSLNLKNINQVQWQQLSTIFFNKSPSFLEFQFVNILKSKGKITWNQEEDKILLEAMSKEKPGKWNEVSKRIFYESECLLFKSPKHCRERWFNHLDGSKNKGSWTLQEDYAIFKFIIQKGKRWACIVKQMGNCRTEHMIKNRYNSLICRLKKNKKRREEEIAQLVFKGLEANVKSERREKRVKNEENIAQQKKSENAAFQTSLQQNIEKSDASEDVKSDQTALKIMEVKYEENGRIQEEFENENGKMLNQGSENVYHGLNYFNYYNYGAELMGMQYYPTIYYTPLPQFVPFYPMCSFAEVPKFQSQ